MTTLVRPSVPATTTEVGFHPAWQPDESATHCPLCTVQFSWLQRKHHCRSCGRIVCGSCSPYRCKVSNPIPAPSEDADGLLRVCATCANPPVPITTPSRVLAQQASAATNNNRDIDTSPAQRRCPICNERNPSDMHVNECLQGNVWSSSPAAMRNRMLTWTCEGLTDGECIICMEAYEKGQRLSRLECLCVFHKACIRGWFDRKGNGVCPTHQLHEQ